MKSYYQCIACLAVNDSKIERCCVCGVKCSSCAKLYVDSAEYNRLREGIEWWLKRMEYYSDNQYGKAEMRKLVEQDHEKEV